MKYLVLFAVLLIAYMVWRNNRLRDESGGAPPRGPGAGTGPQEMVRCPVCGVHLPRSEAVPGAGGILYCSQEHRQRAGG